MNDTSNTADTLYVSEIIERVEELREERDGFVIGAPDGTETESPEEWAEQNPEDSEELETLEGLLSQLAGYGGDEQWEGKWYPQSLIHRDYFVTAMEELCKDIGELPKEIPGYIVIDWEATANNLEVDYSTVDYNGQEFLYR